METVYLAAISAPRLPARTASATERSIPTKAKSFPFDASSFRALSSNDSRSSEAPIQFKT